MNATATACQPELNFNAAREGARAAPAPAEIAALITWLRGRGWVTARQISEQLGMEDRKVRECAEHSDGEILSGPGCPGYCAFTGETSLGDANRAALRLESQAAKMLDRAKTIRRRLHRYGCGA